MGPSGITPIDSMVPIRERFLAPSLLAPFADDIARRLSRISMGPLLETSAGTGTLTQAIGSALSAGLTIIATDPDQANVDHAASRPGRARIAQRRAHPCALPFAGASFGIVANHFGVAVIGHRIQAFREARRGTRPGGR